MNSALYIGATGMKGMSQGMQVTTNNLANVSTIGYKQQNTLFSDMLSTSQGGTGDWWNAQENSRVALGQTGKGVQVDAVRTIFQQGALEPTNTVTDMAINGKGFFQVSDGANLYYTRAATSARTTRACGAPPRAWPSTATSITRTAAWAACRKSRSTGSAPCPPRAGPGGSDPQSEFEPK